MAGRAAPLTVCLLLVLQIALAAQPAVQQASAGDEATATPYLIDVSRVESWSFFTPHEGGADPTYTTVGNRATLGVRVTSRHFDVDGAFRYAQLLNLPENSIGPGALGGGALYFFSAEAPAAYQLYFKTMWARLKDPRRGLSVSAGRMAFSSGEENPSGVAALDDLQRRRIGARMIGNFEGSIFERSFDAMRVDIDRRGWAANTALLFPTQGGYEESANPTISAVKVMAASATLKPALLPHQLLQAFAYHYRDHRDIDSRPDNIVLGSLRTDISLTTIGASHVGLFPFESGELETVAWFAGQAGDWYGQEHGAVSAAVESGFQFAVATRPKFRLGHTFASGDSNPADGRHGTFFQMLPSIERYAASTAYALMNLRDTFAEVSIEPRHDLRLGLDLHRLALVNAADRWYYGSGATSRTGSFFGFTSRPTRGATSLGTIAQASVDVAINPLWRMRAYVGVMRGGEVVRRTFAGRRLVMFQFENTLSF